MPTDRDAIAGAILTCGRADLDRCRLIRMPDTLDLQELLVAESMRAELEGDPRIEILGEPVPMTFDAHGALGGWGQ